MAGLPCLQAPLAVQRAPALTPRLPGGSARRRNGRSVLPPRRVLANSTPENIARPPTWRETLRGAIFWARPQHWDHVPRSRYLTLVFMLFKVVGTIGGYRGRAHFARRSGLKVVDAIRREAADAVDATSEDFAEKFPSVAARVAGAGPSSAPCLAAVLPTFARTPADLEEFAATLAALREQTKPPEVVVVVDDASPADLSPALSAWQDDSSIAHVRMSANTGPAGARSVGMRLLRRWASGRRVLACFTDSDAAPGADWCEAMRSAQEQFPGIITGPTLSRDASHTGRFHDHFGSLNGRWKWDDLPAVLLYGCTCNFSVDLSLLRDLEFDPVFRRPGFEDIELCWRARKEHKVLTRYCEGARVYHEYDRGLVGLYKQFWKYGNTEPIMAHLHPDFSFQDSRPVVAGFKDPRVQALQSSIPPGAEAAGAQVIRKLQGLFRAPGETPEPGP